MAIAKTVFGHLQDGQTVHSYEITGKSGLSVKILDLGANLHSVLFAGKDLVLGYNDPNDYMDKDSGYIGATVGRYANRIAGARFPLNGEMIQLNVNQDNGNQLHGGITGFDKQIWDMETVNEYTLKARLTSPDGQEGYPGTLQVCVTFTVTEHNALSIQYDAISDKDTVANFTNHAYFNLNGVDGGYIGDTEVTVYADAYTPANENMIPLAITPVDGTPFDFREPKPLGEALESNHPHIVQCRGIDHNFVLGVKEDKPRPAMRAVSEKSGIAVTCLTDLPGIQIYTGNFLDSPTGKMGAMTPHTGFCMETQFFPDSPNRPDFPSPFLKAGEAFHSETIFCFEQV